MKKFVVLIALAAMISCNNATNNDAASTPKKDTSNTAESTLPPMDSATAAKRFTEAMTPGEMHKMLATLAGSWSGDVTFWPHENYPGEKSVISFENKMILGGRFLQTTETGTFEGKPYEGIDMLGYDNNKKMFVFTQQENMSTGIIYTEGSYDSTNKVITMKGHYDDYSGATVFRETYKITDDTHLEIDWYGTQPGGKEEKISESKLTRK